MAPDVSVLFEPLHVKGFTLRNRLVMPPMVTNRGIDTPDGAAWYAERAAGGVGLVIVESTRVDRFGSELNEAGLRRLTDAIHAAGAKGVIQLFPATFGSGTAPADLDTRQISQIIELFELAARICVEAGFDGVEPHGAHGFLLNQFFSPAHNQRTDWFGGSLENRMRMAQEIAHATRRGLGGSKLLLYRHTPVQENSYTIEESGQFAQRLIEAGVDILDISPASNHAPGDMAEPFRALGVPVIAVNQMDEEARAVETLAQGRADLIAIGRGLIADPEWPKKIREGRTSEIVRCIRCNEKCFGNLREGRAVACTQWE